MKKTTIAAFMVLGLVALVAVPGFAKPGQGKGQEAAAQDQGAGEGQVFGEEAPASQCHAADMGGEAKGCGCGAMMAEEGKGCACGCQEGGECKCGPDCKCGCHNKDAQGAGEGKGCACQMGGEGKGCGCGAMMGEGKGCACGMGEEGKGCGCGMGEGKGCGMGEGHGKGHHDGHNGGHKFWKCPKASAELGLTDEQKKKLEDMDADAEKKAEAIHAEMKVLKDQMKALFEADPIDVNAVRALAGQIAQKKADKKVLHMVQKAEAMNVLTAEQRGKMKELHKKMKDGKGPMDQDDAEIKCPKAMEEKAAHLEKKAKELDGKSKELKARAKTLKANAKKAKAAKSGKGKK